jgi:hypothetical protein
MVYLRARFRRRAAVPFGKSSAFSILFPRWSYPNTSSPVLSEIQNTGDMRDLGMRGTSSKRSPRLVRRTVLHSLGDRFIDEFFLDSESVRCSPTATGSPRRVNSGVLSGPSGQEEGAGQSFHNVETFAARAAAGIYRRRPAMTSGRFAVIASRWAPWHQKTRPKKAASQATEKQKPSGATGFPRNLARGSLEGCDPNGDIWNARFSMRQKLTVYLPPDLLQQIADLAGRKRLSQSAIVETAVMSFLSPDGAERTEAAFARRLDRLTRQFQRLERSADVTMEALALFVRSWLTVTPPLPPDAHAAAQAKAQQRFGMFVEALGERLQKGRSLLNEIPQDVGDESSPGSGNATMEEIS